MPEKDPQNINAVLIGFAFIMSVGGSLVAYFRNLHSKKLAFNWFDLIIRLLTGIFIGLLTAAFVKQLGYGELVVGALAGVAGMFSEQIVKLLEVWIFKVARDRFGVELDPNKSTQKEDKKQ